MNYAGKIEAQLKGEFADLPEGMSIPEELGAARQASEVACRSTRGARGGGKERYERKQTEHEQKLAGRGEKTKASGKKPGCGQNAGGGS